jgi:hypothetical protein
MRDTDEGLASCCTKLFKKDNAFDIKMIGRFIKDEEIYFLE